MDETLLKPLNYNYFPQHDRLMEITKKNNTNNQHESDKKVYEFLSFHPVCTSSEMIGTSIEELLMHNYPTKRSWECSRLCDFPQELIIRLDSRSHLKYVLIRAKQNRPIQEIELHIGDGVEGNFNVASYRRMNKGKFINDEPQTIKVDGIGNYLKLIFTKPSLKTLENPYGQVSLTQIKIFGKKIKHCTYTDYPRFEANKTQDLLDRILIDIGVPLNDPYSFVNDIDQETAAVDEDTRITLKDMSNILYHSDKSNYLI